MNRNDLWKSDAFRRWWDEDWSWDGLGKKFTREKLSPNEQATSESLQDHWRDEETRLIPFAGRHWTRFHLPPFDIGGHSCPENIWSNAKNASFIPDVQDKITKDAQQVFGAMQSPRREHYSDLRGLFFAETIDLSMSFLAADFSSAWFLKRCRFQSPQTISVFQRTIFVGPSLFQSITFLREGLFEEAEFWGECKFVESTFQKWTTFSNAKFRGATFLAATFEEIVNFDGAEFASLRIESSFHDHLHVGGVKGQNLVIAGGIFDKHVDISQVQIEHIEFSNCDFQGNFYLARSTIGTVVAASDTTFRKEADFSGCLIKNELSMPNARFQGEASFVGCRIQGWCSFEGSIWESSANFWDARFTTDASFSGVQFNKEVRFESVQIGGTANFSGASFDGSASFAVFRVGGQANFRDCKFNSSVSFSRAHFGSSADFSGSEPFKHEVSFDNAQFDADVDFSKRQFREETSFSHARFKGIPKFFDAHLHPNTSFDRTQFHTGRAPKTRRLFSREALTKRLKLFRWPEHWYQVPAYTWDWLPKQISKLWKDIKDNRDARDHATRKYEKAYGELSNLCADIKAPHDRARFHAYEMRAQRSRTDVDVAARVIGCAYDVLSDYGQSIGKPIIALIFAWIFFAGLYWYFGSPPYSAVLSEPPALDCHLIRSPLEKGSVWVTTGRQFLSSPFGGVPGIAQAPDWFRCADAERPVLLFIAGVFQPLIFVGLTTLLGIAMRRRFRLHE